MSKEEVEEFIKFIGFEFYNTYGSIDVYFYDNKKYRIYFRKNTMNFYKQRETSGYNQLFYRYSFENGLNYLNNYFKYDLRKTKIENILKYE